jgi:membrane protein implicated in regulation of membrane protease activity
METWMWTIWLSVFVIALVIEAIGTDLVSIWFAAGAIVALILSLISGVAWWIELVVFVVISLATLCCFRPLVHRYLRRGLLMNSNIDEIVGKKGLMMEKIDLLHHGTCKINDVVWTAIAEKDNISISKGATVVVLAVSGNKLIVKQLDDVPVEGEN